MPLGVTGGPAVAHDRQGQGGGRFRSLEKKRRKRRPGTVRRISVQAHKSSWCCWVPFLFILIHISLFHFFAVLLGGLTACAPFICTRFTEVHVDREMRRWTGFLCLHLVFVKLKASRPCNSPVLFAALCWNETAAVPWSHIGTMSCGRIRRVSSHASSIELAFAFPRSR